MQGGGERCKRALWWLARGVALVPCQPQSKRLVGGFGPYLEHVTTAAAARFWFGERRCNFAVVTGGGLVALDFDTMDAYTAWAAAWPGLAATYSERTRRGLHAFLLGESASGERDGYEVKGSGSVVVSAPSVVGGFQYHPIEDKAAILAAPVAFPLLSDHCATVPLSKGKVAGGDSSGDTIARIKAAWHVLDLAQSVTAMSPGHGERWWHGRCPLPGHEDNKASFWVDSERGLWGCYGCHVRGDVINLYARLHGLDVGGAIREMAARL